MAKKQQPRKPAKTPAEVHEDQPQDQDGTPTGTQPDTRNKQDKHDKDEPFVIQPLHDETA